MVVVACRRGGDTKKIKSEARRYCTCTMYMLFFLLLSLSLLKACVESCSESASNCSIIYCFRVGSDLSNNCIVAMADHHALKIACSFWWSSSWFELSIMATLIKSGHRYDKRTWWSTRRVTVCGMVFDVEGEINRTWSSYHISVFSVCMLNGSW